MKTIKMAIDAMGALGYGRDYPEAKRMKVHVGAPSPPADPQLIERLISCARLAKADQSKAVPVYQASGEWAGILEDSFALGESLATMFRDGSTSIGSSYSVRGLEGRSLKSTLKRACIIRDVHRDLRVWRSICGAPDAAMLAAPNVGSPWGVTLGGTLMYPGSCRAHYFADHVAGLLDTLDTDGVVVEIGGGYGEFAYRLLKMRPGVKYICFDLPEILVRSAYFLMNALPEKRVMLYDEVGSRPLTAELLDRFDIILVPNFKIADMPALSADVLVNTRSFSEMGWDAIEDYMGHANRIVRSYILHENSNAPVVAHGHTEIPADDFPIPEAFGKVYAQKSPWWIGDGLGALGRYVQYLYRRH